MIKVDTKTRTPINPSETMGQRIRRLRISRGWTQDDLAARCDVSKTAVYYWEKDIVENLKLQTFLRLSEALEVGHTYLIYGPLAQAELKNPREANGHGRVARTKISP